jgi:hypothetical protein
MIRGALAKDKEKKGKEKEKVGEHCIHF